MYSSRWPFYSTCEATIGSSAHMTTCFSMTWYHTVSVAHARRRPTLWSVANVSFLVSSHLSLGLFRAISQHLCQGSYLCQRVEILGSPGKQEVNVCIMNSDRRLLYGCLLMIYLLLAKPTHFSHWIPLSWSRLTQKCSSLIRCTNVLLWGDVVYRLM